MEMNNGAKQQLLMEEFSPTQKWNVVDTTVIIFLVPVCVPAERKGSKVHAL